MVIKLSVVKELEHLRQDGFKSFVLSFDGKFSRHIRIYFNSKYQDLVKMCQNTIGEVFKEQDIMINSVDFINKVIIVDVWNTSEGNFKWKNNK